MQTTKVAGDRGRLNFGIAGKIVVLFGMTLSSYGLFGLGPVMPAIAAAFPDEPNAALLTRLMVSSMGIFVAVISPIVGAVADRVGQRRVLLTSLLVYAIAGAAPYFMNDLTAIVVVRVFQGIAVAAYGTVVLVMLVQNSTGNARDRWLGYLAMVATVGAIFHSPMVGYIGHAYGWRVVFLTFLIALPLLGLALIGFAPDAPRATQAKTERRPFVLGTPLTYVAFALFAGAALIAGNVFVPFRLKEIGITDPQTIGNMLLCTSLPSAVAGFIFGWIRARYSVSGTFVLGFSIMALGVALIAVVGDMPQMIVAMVIAGFGQGVCVPNYWSLGGVVGPEEYRARTMGFAKSGVYGGPLIAQLILEPVVARTTYAVTFAIMAAICASFALFFAWRIARERAVPA